MTDKRVNTLSVIAGLLAGVVFGIMGAALLGNPALGIGIGVVMGLLAGVTVRATQREK